MLKVACPSCAKTLGLPDEAAGRKVKCPKCGAVFRAPAAAPTPAPATPAMTAEKAIREDLETATPYALKEDALTAADMKKSQQAEAVDAMVRDAARVKKRNKAWEIVGLPAKFMKRAALSACVFWIIAYLFTTGMIVLCNHNMEQNERGGGFATVDKLKGKPKYIFITEAFDLSPEEMPPLRFWLIATGGLVVALSIYGLQLSAAESMKKLENYRLSMAGAIVGTLTINLFGIWALLALMDKGVQYEFRVSKRRLEGKVGDALYEEEEEEDLVDEDEEDEDEEEEEEEEEQPRKRVASRKG